MLLIPPILKSSPRGCTGLFILKITQLKQKLVNLVDVFVDETPRWRRQMNVVKRVAFGLRAHIAEHRTASTSRSILTMLPLLCDQQFCFTSTF
jgi:hypothetical protein